MKASTTLFTVSFVSAVVAGWYHLDAAQEADGPDAKPPLTKVLLDGNEIAIGLDQDRVKSGGTVNLSLALLKGQGGEVRVVVQEQSAMMDSRMEPPARTISASIVKVNAGEETIVPVELAGILRDEDADPLMTAGAATRYSILVVSDTDHNGQAMVPVFAYEPEAYKLTVDAPTAAGVGEPTEVTVHVKNTSKKTLTGITVALSTTFISTSETIVVDSLEKGESKTITLHGTRVEAPQGPLLIQAYGWASYGGTAQAWATIDAASGKVADHASTPYQMVATGY